MNNSKRMTKFEMAARVASIAAISFLKESQERASLNIRKSLRVRKAESATKLPPLKTFAVERTISRMDTITINVSKILSPSLK